MHCICSRQDNFIALRVNIPGTSDIQIFFPISEPSPLFFLSGHLLDDTVQECQLQAQKKYFCFYHLKYSSIIRASLNHGIFPIKRIFVSKTPCNKPTFLINLQLQKKKQYTCGNTMKSSNRKQATNMEFKTRSWGSGRKQANINGRLGEEVSAWIKGGPKASP